MLHVSRRKEVFMHSASNTTESRAQHSKYSFRFFLKLLLYSLKKLFVYFKVKASGKGPTTRAFLTSALHGDGKSCRGGKGKVHLKKIAWYDEQL